MKKKHMESVVTKIVRLFPRSFPGGMDELKFAGMVEDYMEIMGDQDYKTVNGAVNELAQSQTFAPSISEILEAVKAIREREAAENAKTVLEKFTDEDGYRYERVDGHMVCVYRPNVKPLKDPAMQAFMDEKRRIYAEVGAPKSYTMKQVRELAAKQGRQLPEQNDQLMLSRILGGKP